MRNPVSVAIGALVLMGVLLFFGAVFLRDQIAKTKAPVLPAATAMADIQADATIKIDFGDSNIQKTYQADGLNAFTILEKLAKDNDITLETQKYDFGTFVKSIGGKQSSADIAWIYFVNGQSGSEAADIYSVKPRDVIEWKFVKPTQ